MGPKDLIQNERNNRNLRLAQTRGAAFLELDILEELLMQIKEGKRIDVNAINDQFSKFISALGKCSAIQAQIDVLDTLLLRFD